MQVFSVLFTNLNDLNLSAYIDPSTAGYIVQAVAGVVIAAGVTIGIFRKKIRLFFTNLKMKRMEKKIRKQGEKQENDKRN